MIWSRKNKRDGITYWFVRYELPDGRRRKEKAGTTKQDAKELLIKRKGEILRGAYEDPKALQAARLTFAELCTRFLEEYASERRSTYYTDTLVGRKEGKPRAILQFFGEISVADLEDDPTVFDAYRKLRLEQVSSSTVRKELTCIGTIFRWAKRQRPRLAQSNPIDDVDKPAEPENLDRPLTWEEWGRVLEAAEPWVRPILRMAAATGCRLKEVVSLSWGNVDTDAGILYVSSDNKTGKPRALPLGERAKEVLKDCRSSRFKGAEVFLDTEKLPYTSTRQRNRISQRTRAAMVAAGVEKGSFKSLRTTVGTVLAEDGYSEALIGTLLGHSWAKAHVTGRHYIRPRVNRLRAMISSLDAWISDGPNSVPSQGQSSQVVERE